MIRTVQHPNQNTKLNFLESPEISITNNGFQNIEIQDIQQHTHGGDTHKCSSFEQ